MGVCRSTARGTRADNKVIPVVTDTSADGAPAGEAPPSGGQPAAQPAQQVEVERKEEPAPQQPQQATEPAEKQEPPDKPSNQQQPLLQQQGSVRSDEGVGMGPPMQVTVTGPAEGSGPKDGVPPSPSGGAGPGQPGPLQPRTSIGSIGSMPKEIKITAPRLVPGTASMTSNGVGSRGGTGSMCSLGLRPGMQRKASELSAKDICSRTAAVGKPFPKRPLGCKLSSHCWSKLEELFGKMDPDGSNAVTRDEALQFFTGAFGKLSVEAMFNEVDVDDSGAITAEEFVDFWVHVRKMGYKESQILEEIEELLLGEAWVDWKDGRNTTKSQHAMGMPKRPMLCKLSAKCWSKCAKLFEMMDFDHSYVVTREKAARHFASRKTHSAGDFTILSVEAMFNEIDQNHHGQITAKEFMKFWVQVKAAGYKEKDIMEELDNLMEGEPWVDWKDGRSVV